MDADATRYYRGVTGNRCQPRTANCFFAAELARSNVRDLSGDPRVIELLAQGVSERDARRWRQLQASVRRQR